MKNRFFPLAVLLALAACLGLAAGPALAKIRTRAPERANPKWRAPQKKPSRSASCPGGFSPYRRYDGRTWCARCPAGWRLTRRLSDNNIICLYCPPGFIVGKRYDGRRECRRCPQGWQEVTRQDGRPWCAGCPGGGRVSRVPGQWRWQCR